MKSRIKKFEDISPVEFLVLRDRLGFKRYMKSKERDPKEREIIIELGLKKIKEQERRNFIPIGYKQRRVKI